MPKITVRCNAESDRRQPRRLYGLPMRTRHYQRLGIMNRLLSVVRSMIDKIIEVSRAVVAGGRYGESNAPASWIRTPE